MRSDRLIAALVALTALGCATGPSEKEDWAEAMHAPPPAPKALVPTGPIDPATYAAQFEQPADCAEGARLLQRRSRDLAWAVLKECVAKGNFDQLRALATPAWTGDLQRRPDAPELLAKVIAARGGSIPSDVSLLQRQKIPLFSLSAGVAQPEVYKGRYIVLRAKVAELRSDGEHTTAKLEETMLRSAAFDMPVGPTEHTTEVRTVSGHVSGRLGALGQAQLGGALATSNDQARYRVVPHYENISTETGREALVRLNGADPFLEPDKEFVILARFEGVRTTSSDDDDAPGLPVLTLVSFHEPNALVVY